MAVSKFVIIYISEQYLSFVQDLSRQRILFVFLINIILASAVWSLNTFMFYSLVSLNS